MRVGLVSAYGSHERVTRIAGELTLLGHEVRVYERRADPSEPDVTTTEAGYLIERTDLGSEDVPAFGRWLAGRWGGEWRPEVVHGHQWIAGLAAAAAVREHRVPLVQTFHSLAAMRLRGLGGVVPDSVERRMVLERVLGRAVDAAVAQSEDEAAELTRMGLPRSSVVVAPAGVDTELFTPEGVAQARVDGSARILVVSGFWPGHGCDTLIRAMTGDAELVIVGPATDDDVRHLTEVARECGRADQVRLIGAVPHDRLPEWYRSADVLACAPDYAPTGVVPLEAMACGVPVVGYDHGGITDVVVDRVTGRLVPVGDVRTLGLTLSGVLADERGRFAYHHASVDRVRSRYTWDRTAVALDRLYHQVLGRPYQPAQETSGESPVPA